MKKSEQGKSGGRVATSQMRLFFALWPDVTVQRALHAVAVQQQPHCRGRLMRSEMLHLTLLFLGNVPLTRLPELCAAASRVREKSFDLELDGFSAWRHNGIAYAFPSHPPQALSQLADSLREVVAQARFRFDRKTFVPHLTLLRQVEHIPAMQSFAAICWQVRQFALVQSGRDANGIPRYFTLQSWLLT